jgi:hypothetical protein
MEQINTVQDLINALQLVENKELPVFVYSEDFDIDLQTISLVDYDISDRVDINVKSANHRMKQGHGIANQVGGRHLNQMIFLEREQIGAETLEFLERNDIINEVDYGNIELTSDMFKQMVENFDNYNKIMSDDKEITLKQIREELGLDVADGLITGKLDFVQIIY